MKNFLPSIISECQTGYVVNKSINDYIRIVQDIINYTEITQSSSEKAYFTLNSKSGAGERFCQGCEVRSSLCATNVRVIRLS